MYLSLSTSDPMHQPGIEPGAQAWEACMLPLHYWCPFLFMRDLLTDISILSQRIYSRSSVDTDGIRTHAGKAHWISSPTP